MSQLKLMEEEKCDLEMTPMIDVTFLLLIFFMCTLKFKTLEGKLSAHLPKDVGVNQSDAEPIEKVEILMRVKVEGRKIRPPGGTPGPYTAADEAETPNTFSVPSLLASPSSRRAPIAIIGLLGGA